MYLQSECIVCKKVLTLYDKSFICKKCQNEQQNTNVQIFNSKNLKCPKCTYLNQQTQIQCVTCGFIFQHNVQKLNVPTDIKKSSSMVNCKKCKLQNHLSNQYCLNCQQQLFEHKKKKCQICELMINQSNYEKHHEECLLSKSVIDLEIHQQPFNVQPLKIQPFHKQPIFIKPLPKPFQKPKLGYFDSINKYVGGLIRKQEKQTRCYFCNQLFPKQIQQEHMKVCQKKVDRSKHLKESFARLTPLQVKAMSYLHQKSSKQHQGVRKSLQERVRKLGYTKQDLNNLQFYTQNYAPIIIQIHISKHMEFFVKDTHYRNQFQTNKSSGSLSRPSRTQWQSRMFDKKYDSAKDFQRVKYGVINFTNDPKGVQCAKSYGPSYFLLKSHVRDRCTFTDKDSSSADAALATLKYGFKVINKMNDIQLKAAFKASKALQQSSGVLVTYKQLQIHGPIQFDKDIQRVYVSRDQIKGQNNLLDLVYLFSQKFKVQHDFI